MALHLGYEHSIIVSVLVNCISHYNELNLTYETIIFTL